MKESGVTHPWFAHDALEVANNDQGGVGRLRICSNQQTITLSSATTTNNLIPAGCNVIGVSFRVTTAVTDDGGDDTWSASLVGGVSSSLITSAPPTVDKCYDVQIQPNLGGRTRSREFTGILGGQEYFSHASNATLQWAGGSDHSIICWVYPILLGSNICPVAGIWDHTGAKREWMLGHVNATNGMKIWAVDAAHSQYYAPAATAWNLTPLQWTMIYAYKEDGVGIGIELNADGDVQTAAMTNAIDTDNAEFQVGSAVDVSGLVGYWQGYIAEVRLYSRLLDATERLDFFQTGTTTDEATGLVAKYLLDEYAGDALDSVGSLDLTDEASAGYGIGPGLTNVKFTPNGGSFSGGVIEVQAYYVQLRSLA